MLPSGAGKRDGTSWGNAFDQRAGTARLAEGLRTGDRFWIGGGTYRDAGIVIHAAGTASAPVVVEGVDRGAGLPLIESTWSESRPDRGATAIEIAPGARHLVVRNLRIRNCMVGINGPPVRGGAGRVGLRFENIGMERIRHGFYLSDCDQLVVADCTLARYTKHGFRVESGCNDVRFLRCTADCSGGDVAWEKLTELLPFGFFANGAAAPNTRLVFEDCLARNNLMPLQKGSYKNGDGFVAEDRSTEVSFVRCRSLRNQDGGFDVKSPGVLFEGCVAIGNGRNFRIWNSGTLQNCFSGWAPTGLWSHGGSVAVSRCTFHSLPGAVAEIEDDVRGVVTFEDCLFSKVKRPDSAGEKGKIEVDASNLMDESPHGAAFRFAAPSADWNGASDVMNSRAHPDKGWRFAEPPARLKSNTTPAK